MFNLRSRFWLAALLVAMLFVNNNASATCIASGDATTLNAELNYWALNAPLPVQIQLEQGVYALQGNNNYISQNQSAPELQLLGGYVPGTNCTSRNVLPGNTVIDGGGLMISQFDVLGDDSVAVEGITFQNFDAGSEGGAVVCKPTGRIIITLLLPSTIACLLVTVV